jgi:hypothetical protein
VARFSRSLIAGVTAFSGRPKRYGIQECHQIMA